MTNFFRKIPQPLVVLVLVLIVLTGHAFASEGDTSASAPVDSAPVDWADVPAISPEDADSYASDDNDNSDWNGDDDYFYFDDYGGYDTFTVSGADVTVNVEKHDTLAVTSMAPDALEVPDGSAYSHAELDTPTLAETIRSLFGSYTPRTQTVTTYYDGQPISTDEQIVPGLAGLDYEWLAGVGLFALITFCLFRLLGGVLKNG